MNQIPLSEINAAMARGQSGLAHFYIRFNHLAEMDVVDGDRKVGDLYAEELLDGQQSVCMLTAEGPIKMTRVIVDGSQSHLVLACVPDYLHDALGPVSREYAMDARVVAAIIGDLGGKFPTHLQHHMQGVRQPEALAGYAENLLGNQWRGNKTSVYRKTTIGMGDGKLTPPGTPAGFIVPWTDMVETYRHRITDILADQMGVPKSTAHQYLMTHRFTEDPDGRIREIINSLIP